MSDEKAVEAAYQAAYHAEWRCICPPEEGCDMTVCRCAIRVALAAARPHILEEAAWKEDEKHEQWCISKGRNPKDYGTKHSIAAAAIRAAKEGEG